ncbi:MAG: hypothetical protein V2I27_15270 [Erythrobacter sp.]|jgi:hypothetical protein|nr:hypothetical protein [Erythrobacter sp.]
MDLNQLLYNHQVALMNQRGSTVRADRETYFDLVEYYAKRIRDTRRVSGAGEQR